MVNFKNTVGFHDLMVAANWDVQRMDHWDTQFKYTFENFFHPFVGEMITRLNTHSLPGIFDPVWQDGLKTPDPRTDPANDFFHNFYQPQTSRLVQVESSRKELDLSEHGPYANYNWELFFHVPLTVAVHLSKTRRFAEAQRWFHYIFDPTSNDQSAAPPKRFWNFLAFRQDKDPKQIDTLLELLSRPAAELSPDDQRVRADILNGYRGILDKPFQPHAVARTRHLAYQYSVVMKYLDNLIAWGDDLFAQDTLESINEATQLYVLAANLLGPRPQRIPPRGTVQPKTFAQLKAATLDAMGNALVELEGKFPFNLGPTGAGASTDSESAAPLFGIGRTLYFCIPRNDKMLSYWDTVGDRLYKIRHCMNIQGVMRPLALFDPPIDPGLLVKAAAAGLDLSSVVSGLNQPIGPVRCLVLIQKALELCAEVRGLGNALLSAIERGDAEHLALVRQRHEAQIQQMAQEVRFLQWKQAQEATQSLLTARATALERLHFNQRLLGLPADQNAPETLALDRRELTEENFDDAYAALVEQYVQPLTLQAIPKLKIAGDTSLTQQSGASGQGQLYLNTNEDDELNTLLPHAMDLRSLGSALITIASSLLPIPESKIAGHFWGIGIDVTIPGGTKLAAISQKAGELAQLAAAWEQDQAGMVARKAGYERRADDWLLQHNLAARELMQIGRQILTSLIAEQVAHHEYQSLQQQISNAQEVDQFLHDKFTNEDLHLWMQGEISRLYYEYYRLAFDTARKAERTMKQELMRPELDAQDFVKFNYWDGGRKGLLSGEALHLDVKKMEMAYLENNKREYELVKHVSLRQLDSLALLNLKATGTCEVAVPEWVFDLDNPGHYMRRLKNVSLSIPSVTGPYTSVSCTLSLLKSSLRKMALGDDYARQGAEDDRFVDYSGTIQSVVTSSANNDGGLFETNLRDERFLPFEGAGAESSWRLELPSAFRQFDYNTITDVIIHLRYTARHGGNILRDRAVSSLKAMVGQASASGLARLFSLKHDFPSEWHQFSSGNQDFAATVTHDFFPYFTKGSDLRLDTFKVYAFPNGNLESLTPQGLDPGTLSQTFKDSGEFVLTLSPDAVVLVRQSQADVFVVIEYSLTS